MKSNAPESDVARYEPYLRGTIADAWQRCLPVWSARGRVTDWPRGVRFTHHTPSFETYLGRLFVKRFAADYLFLLDRFAHGSSLESNCAFDLLDFLAQHLYETRAPLPEALRTCELPLPSHIRTEIAADRIYRDHGLDTIGKLLKFEHHGQEPAGA